MNFGQAIASCMGKYATFAGRASRGEFWWFYLFTVLLSWGATLVSSLALFPGDPDMAEILPSLVSLAVLLPTLAVGCRRLHDIGKSGWWQLIALTVVGIILLVVWWAQPPRPEAEKYALTNADPG